MSEIKLFGRIIIKSRIAAITGLHIGGSGAGLEIGGIDKEVIRNPLNNQPYIPGSGLRGKMRSQLEKVLQLPQNNPIGQVTIHTCQNEGDFQKCPVCNIFGVPGEKDFSRPARLIVRDVALSSKSVKEMAQLRDLPFAELKTEVAIDRVTSAAVPRTLERVPAGAVFGPAELVFNLYNPEDFNRLKSVFEAMQLVEDDYLGGSGSRGSGKIKFEGIKLALRSGDNYGDLVEYEKFDTVQQVLEKFTEVLAWAKSKIKVS